jgi:hypothetical protein
MESTNVQSSSGKMSPTDLDSCAKVCSECYEICTKTIKHCLEKGGEHAEPSHINLLTDCVCICATSADFLIRGSENHMQTCRACAEICRLCEEECESMSGDSEMDRCAEACKKCGESCEQMSSNLI